MTNSSVTQARELPLALLIVATASAIVVATEFIVIGLLPVLSRDFGVSIAVAGRLVGAFALSASLLGPPLTLATARMSPRNVLIGTLLLFATTNLAVLLQPSFETMLTVRIIQGAVLPVFIGVGAEIVSRLSPPEQRGRSLARANTGFAVGVVCALPAGVALAEGGLWTPSFVALIVFAVAAAGLVALGLPRISGNSAPRAEQAWRFVCGPQFVTHLMLSIAVFAAMFSAYTYLTAWLAERAGFSNWQIALVLLEFGAAGLLGNAAAGRVADQAPLSTTALAVIVVALAALALSLVDDTLLRLVVLGIWGTAHTACVTLCQVRVTLAGRSMPAFAMAMNISAANLGIALGALVGGWVVTRWGVNAMGWGSLVLTPVMLGLAALLGVRRERA